MKLGSVCVPVGAQAYKNEIFIQNVSNPKFAAFSSFTDWIFGVNHQYKFLFFFILYFTNDAKDCERVVPVCETPRGVS